MGFQLKLNKTKTNPCKACGKPIEFEPMVMDGHVFDSGPDVCDDCAPGVLSAERQARVETRQGITRDLLIRQSGIHPELRSYNPKIGNMALLEWIRDHRDKWLWIGDLNRVGKTRAANYAAYRMISDYLIPAIVVVAPIEFSRISMLKQESPSDAQARIDELRSIRLLVIDDLGKERMSEAKAEALWAIVDSRRNENKTTWITTNHNDEALSHRIGENYGCGIVARLLEVCKLWTGLSAPSPSTDRLNIRV